MPLALSQLGGAGRRLTAIAFALLPFLATPTDSSVHPQAGRELLFAEEFTDGVGAFAYDATWGCGFGSQSDFMGDLQQVVVAAGVATLRAERRHTPCEREYASAVMSTASTFGTAFGYFEAKIRFDRGTGMWPAFWLQPTDGTWPPEIDIMEAYPNENGAWPGPTRYMSTLHHDPDGDPIDVVTEPGFDITEAWHVYAVDWQPSLLTFYFDGQEVGRIDVNVPDKPMYIILNLAVGSWTAEADDTTPPRAEMQIDYVRVWR
jgi:beta-glucanase (GH16 family)